MNDHYTPTTQELLDKVLDIAHKGAVHSYKNFIRNGQLTNADVLRYLNKDNSNLALFEAWVISISEDKEDTE